MSSKMIAAAAALLVSTSAMAQAGPVAEKTSAQLVCELTGDCGQDGVEATQDKPDSRGFNINKRVAAPTPAATAPRVAAPARTAAPARVAAPAARATVANAGRARSPLATRQVGRSNLSIGFVSGSATLTDSGKEMAEGFLMAMRTPQLAGKRFQINGHTDAVGSRSLNLELSRRRAQALVDYLVEKGASPSQFEVRGLGFDQPLAGTSPRAAANRRVEVVKLD